MLCIYEWGRRVGLAFVHRLDVQSHAEDEVQQNGENNGLSTARAFVAFGDVVHGGNGWDE